MFPLLHDGDLIVVKEIAQNLLRRGNILVYREKDGEYLVHRLVKRGKGNILYIRGDGYNLPFELATADAVIGKAVGFIRNSKYNTLNRTKEIHSWSVSLFKEYAKRIMRDIFRPVENAR